MPETIAERIRRMYQTGAAQPVEPPPLPMPPSARGWENPYGEVTYDSGFPQPGRQFGDPLFTPRPSRRQAAVDAAAGVQSGGAGADVELVPPERPPAQTMAERVRLAIPSMGDVGRSIGRGATAGARAAYLGGAALIPGNQPGESEDPGYARRVTESIIPGTAGVVADTAKALASPIDTTRQWAGMAKGMLQLAIPGTQDDEQHVRRAAHYLASTYGSPAKLQEAFANDAPRTIRDLTSVLTLSPLGLAGAGQRAAEETEPARLPVHMRGAALEATDWEDRLKSRIYEAGNALMGYLGRQSGAARKMLAEASHPLRHPLQTAESLGALAMSVVSNVLPKEQGNEDLARKTAAEMYQRLRDRYQTLDALKATLSEDTPGAMADLMGVLTGGVSLANAPRTLGNLGRRAAGIPERAPDPEALTSPRELARQLREAEAPGDVEVLPPETPLAAQRRRSTATLGERMRHRAGQVIGHLVDPAVSVGAGIRAAGRGIGRVAGGSAAIASGAATQTGGRTVAGMYRAGRAGGRPDELARGHLTQIPGDELVGAVERRLDDIQDDYQRTMRDAVRDMDAQTDLDRIDRAEGPLTEGERTLIDEVVAAGARRDQYHRNADIVDAADLDRLDQALAGGLDSIPRVTRGVRPSVALEAMSSRQRDSVMRLYRDALDADARDAQGDPARIQAMSGVTASAGRVGSYDQPGPTPAGTPRRPDAVASPREQAADIAYFDREQGRYVRPNKPIEGASFPPGRFNKDLEQEIYNLQESIDNDPRFATDPLFHKYRIVWPDKRSRPSARQMYEDAKRVLEMRDRSGFGDHPGTDEILRPFIARYERQMADADQIIDQGRRARGEGPDPDVNQGPSPDYLPDHELDAVERELVDSLGPEFRPSGLEARLDEAWDQRVSAPIDERLEGAWSRYADEVPAIPAPPQPGTRAAGLRDALGERLLTALESDWKKRHPSAEQQRQSLKNLASPLPSRGGRAAQHRDMQSRLARSRAGDQRQENLRRGREQNTSVKDPVTGRFRALTPHERANRGVVNVARGVADATRSAGRLAKDLWNLKTIFKPGRLARGKLADLFSGRDTMTPSARTERIKGRLPTIQRLQRQLRKEASNRIDFSRIFLEVEDALADVSKGRDLDPKYRKYEIEVADVIRDFVDMPLHDQNVASLGSLYRKVVKAAGQATGKREIRQLNTLRRIVRKEIDRQGAQVAPIFQGYIDAIDHFSDKLDGMRKSIEGGRGSSVETSLRKILAATRAGSRTGRGRRDPATLMRDEMLQSILDPELEARLSGAMMQDIMPSRFGRYGGVAALATGLNPMAAALAGVTSPRLAGWSALTAGRLARSGPARLVKGMYSSEHADKTYRAGQLARIVEELREDDSDRPRIRRGRGRNWAHDNLVRMLAGQ